MRYGIMDQQRVASPMEGRGTGVRHAGGGAMGKAGMNAPTGGFLRGPSGGLLMNGMNPNPGSLSQDAMNPGPTPGFGTGVFGQPK